MGAPECQHIFVLECSESSKSDWNYVRKLLASKYFAIDFHRTKLTPEYLGGKTNYGSDQIKKKIIDDINRYPGKTFVHFIFDVDRGLTKDKALNGKIIDYIDGLVLPKKSSKDIVWFNKSIELVVLGRPVAESKKVETAIAFYTQGCYELNEKNMLALSGAELCHPGKSNLLTVLYQSLPIGDKAKVLRDSLKCKSKKKTS